MIAIGCDHGAFNLKNAVKKYLEERGLEVKDFGIYEEGRVDYPDIAEVVCKSIVSGECEKGILLCGTGIGISISANKIKGVRCALCGDSFSAKMTRLHNDANVLAMGAGIVGGNLALEIVDVFLGTEFSGEERHQRRIYLIESI